MRFRETWDNFRTEIKAKREKRSLLNAVLKLSDEEQIKSFFKKHFEDLITQNCPNPQDTAIDDILWALGEVDDTERTQIWQAALKAEFELGEDTLPE